MKKQTLFFVILLLLFTSVSIPVSASPRFDYRIVKEDVFLMTENNMFLVQPVSIVCAGSMLYFAAQDFTAKKDMIVNRTKNINVIVDEKTRKVIKATFLLAGENNAVYKDYELVLFLEIREGFPFLAIYSKFVYTGSGTRECGINWALDSAYEPFRYYTIPHKGEIKTFRLVKTRRTKIGQANWIFANTGKGTGGGLIAPAALLGRGEDFIFLNSVPAKKKLGRGESIDLFMIFMPINRNFKILPEIFEKVKDINWKYENK
jgi:hypothetical protein